MSSLATKHKAQMSCICSSTANNFGELKVQKSQLRRCDCSPESRNSWNLITMRNVSRPKKHLWSHSNLFFCVFMWVKYPSWWKWKSNKNSIQVVVYLSSLVELRQILGRKCENGTFYGSKLFRFFVVFSILKITHSNFKSTRWRRLEMHIHTFFFADIDFLFNIRWICFWCSQSTKHLCSGWSNEWTGANI